MNYDFIIYGGGLSSEIAVLALAKNGFKVCFIQNQSNQKYDSNLVTFLSTGSVNYLAGIIDNPKELNEFAEIKKITCKLISYSKSSNITFENDLNSDLGKILPNKTINSLLHLSLKNSKNIEIIYKTKSIQKKMDENKVCVVVDKKKEIFAKTFILSVDEQNLLDGANINFISYDLNQTALSMNVSGDFKKQNHAFQIFTQSGPLAFLPYTKNQASLVWSVKNDSKELLDEKIIIDKKINNYLSSDIGPLKIEDIEHHKLNFKFAKKLYDGNTIIIGNIAHNIHPIAGQGLNLSIKDISLFVDIILKYSSLGYEVNERLAFKEFDQLRKIDNAAYSFGTLTLDNLLSSKSKLVNQITGVGIKILERSRYLKTKIVKSATGFDHFNTL